MPIELLGHLLTINVAQEVFQEYFGREMRDRAGLGSRQGSGIPQGKDIVVAVGEERVPVYGDVVQLVS